MDESFQRQSSSDGDQESATKHVTIPYLPPCRVCQSSASGFHYGVNTCEACKGFFRRSISRKIPYALCCNGSRCVIDKEERNSCTACRYQKCMRVGMSKSAIKTGRYTHKKRTSDTLEIKYGSCNSQSDSPASSVAHPTPCDPLATKLLLDEPGTSQRPLDLSSLCNPSLAGQSDELAANGCRVVHEAFCAAFPNSVYLYENFEEICRTVMNILKENKIETVTNVISSTGILTSDKEKQSIKTLTSRDEVLGSIESMNSSVSGDLLWELPEYKLAYKELFESWSSNLDRFVRNLVAFAKRLPGFNSLGIEDQIILIKSARPEMSSLIKTKHFIAEARAFVNYDIITDTMVLMPGRLLMKLLIGHNDVIGEGISDHKLTFKRFRSKMAAVNMHSTDLSIMCALVLLTPDREGLTDTSRTQLTELQEDLITILKHNLKKTHPNDELSLPRLLLLLPTLRDLGEFNKQAMLSAQRRLNPQISGVLCDVLPHIESSSAECLPIDLTKEN